MLLNDNRRIKHFPYTAVKQNKAFTMNCADCLFMLNVSGRKLPQTTRRLVVSYKTERAMLLLQRKLQRWRLPVSTFASRCPQWQHRPSTIFCLTHKNIFGILLQASLIYGILVGCPLPPDQTPFAS